MGRRRGTMIRESGNPAGRCFYTALRVKGRLRMQFRKRCRSVLLCVVIALVWPIPWFPSVFAQEPTEPVPVIETREVVVSATKTPLPVSHVTSTVEVITGEELERKKLKTVIDGLRLAQGVFASSSGGPGTEATVKMRGAFARHTLVL